MAKEYQHLKIVLLQIRDHRESLLQERRCFIEHCRLEADAFRFINLVDEPKLRFSHIENADVVIIGGSGSFSVTEDYPFTPWLRDVTLELFEKARPLFGSCWGHQFMALCGGGEVITDKEQSEIGSFEIQLNQRALSEPLFEDFPQKFIAQLGHNDRVVKLGSGWVEMASSDACANQIVFREDSPIISTQFHPELDEIALRERLAVYLQEYLPLPESREELIRSLRPSPHADLILERFLRLFALRD